MNRPAALGSLLALSCASASTPSTNVDPSCALPTTYVLQPDTPAGSEDYICYAFDAGALDGATLRAIHWTVPATGGVIWHHATLYAVTETFPAGPAHCDGMPPGSVGLHVWTPGGAALVLPADVGLQLPSGTSRFVVELHVLRINDDAPAEAGSVGICSQREPVAHRAAFFAVVAPVPAIRPETNETSSASCTFVGGAHLWSIWPHMHRLGTAIEARLLQKSGDTSRLARVDPWNFSAQRTYPLDLDVSAGDAIESQCWWTNPTDTYVFAGPNTSDEMCNQGLIGWPAASLPCVTSP
jgi:hypothetical protein